MIEKTTYGLRRSAEDDEGFSLVELAIYIVLLGIVISIVAAVIVVSFRSEQTVSDTTNVASASQNFISAFDRDMRNARAVTVSPDGSTITATTASTSGALCWRDVTWAFIGDGLERNGGALIDAGITGGTFSVSDTSGIISRTDTDRTVTYDFYLGAQASATHHISGSLDIGPAGQAEGSTCP